MGKIFLAVVILGTFLLPKDVILAKKLSGSEAMRDMILKHFGDREGMVKKIVDPLRAAAKSEEEHKKV